MQDVISLTQQLVEIPSVSRRSNAEISDFISQWLEYRGFFVERLTYKDDEGQMKVNLVARLGEGGGGLAFCSHSDTVPGQEDEWPAFEPAVRDSRLFGRGSCDMKGPLAATMIAAGQVDVAHLNAPVYVVVTADEELGLEGAKYVSENSEILETARPRHGVIAEPTRLIPVYGHKGYAQIKVTAFGQAAHTSTGLGRSANFVIAPFLADMAALNQRLEIDRSFSNPLFSPPTIGFNMIINDGQTPPNVTASKSEAVLTFRVMPGARAADLVELILEKAREYDLDTEVKMAEALFTSRESKVVKTACELTGILNPELVPYGTDGIYLQNCIDDLIILGPGDIAQAHTVGEYISIDELQKSVEIYQKMIERLCY